MGTSGISSSFLGLSRSSGQVTHVLLTRSRLCPGPKPGSSLHLHVLSTPPAFVLSQDQTLREELLERSPRAANRHVELSWISVQHPYTGRLRSMTGSFSGPPGPGWVPADRTWTHTRIRRSKVRMLLSFQRPSRPSGRRGHLRER